MINFVVLEKGAFSWIFSNVNEILLVPIYDNIQSQLSIWFTDKKCIKKRTRRDSKRYLGHRYGIQRMHVARFGIRFTQPQSACGPLPWFALVSVDSFTSFPAKPDSLPRFSQARNYSSPPRFRYARNARVHRTDTRIAPAWPLQTARSEFHIGTHKNRTIREG